MTKVAVLCDFDGTVAQDDVGNLFFGQFGGAQSAEIVEDWKSGLISSRTCLEREAALVKTTGNEIDRFLSQRKLDPYFKDFVDFAGRNGFEVVILSDGLDHYIERMLIRNGLGGIEFHSNVLKFVNGGIRVEFPNYDKRDCRDCGNCKTHHLEKLKNAGYYIVYVGNGLSDRCPSTFSDLVFAKDELLEFCQCNAVNHVAFKTFRDVERELLHRFVLAE